jgi:hypothetical protein
VPIPPLPDNVKDWAGVATPVIALLSGCVAAWKRFSELRQTRAQRELERQTKEQQRQQHASELRWRCRPQCEAYHPNR